MELCLVADGAYDGFWDIALKRWDVTASAVIVREAGGRVSGFDDDGLSLEHFERDGGRVIASNGSIHEELRRAVRGALPLPPGLPTKKGMG
jgi:myo-inositol-1(or 4)-monophosphatase